MRAALRWALLAACAGLTGAGCRTGELPPPPPPAADPALEAARAGGATPFRVALLPLRPPAPSLDRPEPGRFEPTTKQGLDLGAGREALAGALEAAGLFARVVARGPAEAGRPPAEGLAWRAGDDLVLEVDLERYALEYLGHEHYLAWVGLLVTWVWPAWFVEVDRYGVGLTASVRLRGIQGSAPPIFEARYVIDARETAQALTPTDRGHVGLFDILALWSVEESLEPSHWEAIGRALAPHAWRRLALLLARDLATQVALPLRDGPAPARDLVLRRARKRLALVAGVSRCDDAALGTLPAAADDVATVASAWCSPAGGGLLAGRDLLTLVDGQATRAALVGSVEELARRVAPGDEVLLYFAGRGVTLADGRPAVLPHDARGADLEASALPLAELLLPIPAGVQVGLVVEADFDAGARASDGPDVGARRPLDLAGLERELGAGRAALLASGPGQTAHDLPGVGRGLLTALLLGGLAGGADADRDGRVSWAEAAEVAARLVASRAGLEGLDQQPVRLGACDIVWPR